MTNKPQHTPDWSLTDKAAIILKSYGVDDPEAARAVVALVMGEAADIIDAEWRKNGGMNCTGVCATLRALIPEAKP